MHRGYEELIQEGTDIIWVKYINGSWTYTPVDKLVGYCFCDTHKGYLSKSLLAEHKCIEKNCSFLEKYEDFPYLVSVKRRETEKEQQKQLERKAKEHEEKETAKNIEKAKKLIQEEITKQDYPIEITKVSLHRDSATKKKYIVINYVSGCSYNNHWKYHFIIRAVATHISGRCVLRHVKDPNGNYETIKEWHKFCAEQTKKQTI